MSDARLGGKLETLFVAWITATKGSLLSGLTIMGAHGVTEPPASFVSVWCGQCTRHPDFEGVTGAQVPQRARVELFLKQANSAGVNSTTGAQWADELSQILVQRAVAFTVNATTDVVTSAGHYLVDGLRVRVSASTTLPGGLSPGVDYWLRDCTNDTFKLAASLGGSAIDLTSAGTGTLTLKTADDFAALMAAGNAGGRLHPSEGLKIYQVSLLDEQSGVAGMNFLWTAGLEVDAENFDFTG